MVTSVYADDFAQGRQIYIQEGCINCHSQFIRPSGRDIEMWGPYVAHEKLVKELPPLIGNRRQGPDLLNIGNRRSFEWLKLHMIWPRLLSPNSRMPSYAHLFKDSKGENLVNYLASLGKNNLDDRLSFIKTWKLQPQTKQISADEISALYQSSCAQCHGTKGLGDGPVAKFLRNKPRNFVADPWIYVDKLSPNFDESLARVIKFGIYGTSMPGHEYLRDDEILGLVDKVKAFIVNEK